MLKQSLQQKLGLKINPLQIQLIKLLELPTYQLEQRIKEELEQNPLLEEVEEKGETDVNEETATDSGEEFDDDYQEGESEEENDLRGDDDFSLEDYMTDDDDTPDYRLNSSNASKDEETRDFVFSQASSFRESLIAQLGTRPLSDLERRITEYIIGNIDEDGYLRRDIENIVDGLLFCALDERAGVDYYDIRLSFLGRYLVACVNEPLQHYLGIRKIFRTTERYKTDLRHNYLSNFTNMRERPRGAAPLMMPKSLYQTPIRRSQT